MTTVVHHRCEAFYGDGSPVYSTVLGKFHFEVKVESNIIISKMQYNRENRSKYVYTLIEFSNNGTTIFLILNCTCSTEYQENYRLTSISKNVVFFL